MFLVCMISARPEDHGAKARKGIHSEGVDGEDPLETEGPVEPMKLDADGRRYLSHASCGPEASGFRVNGKRHDRVRVLVGGEKESSRGVDPEAAGRLTLG